MDNHVDNLSGVWISGVEDVDELSTRMVDRYVDELGETVERASAIHMPRGQDCGRTGERVDGRLDLSTHPPPRPLVVPTPSQRCPRRREGSRVRVSACEAGNQAGSRPVRDDANAVVHTIHRPYYDHCYFSLTL